MKNRKKLVMNVSTIYENEALKKYLEEMALKGWKLIKIGSFLHFEACAPHPVRYCVEVMEKASPFASNQTPALKKYREFCQEAGWDYIGTNGYLHVFCTEDPEALPVETDTHERFERMLHATSKNSRMNLLLFGFLIFLNLYSCYRAGSIRNLNFATALFLGIFLVLYEGSFLRWKHLAIRSLQASGTLPISSWRKVMRKERCLFCLVLLYLLLSLGFLTSRYTSENIRFQIITFFAVYLVLFFLLAFLFRGILLWLREKKSYRTGINLMIYWGIFILLILLITFTGSALIFQMF